MLVRMPSTSLAHWGRVSLVLALAGLWLSSSCTPSEDTEPFIPAREGPTQPAANGDLLSADDACARLLAAAEDAYDRLGCDERKVSECPGFLGPAGGNGCYEYDEKSISECESAYDDARSCQVLPCIVTAQRNDQLPGCELADNGAGGQGGVSSLGGAPNGGAGPEQGGDGPLPEAGAPGMVEVGGAPGAGGAPSGGAP
jgi:hypothetical protein